MDGETAIITEVKGNKLQDNDIDFRRLNQLCYSTPLVSLPHTSRFFVATNRVEASISAMLKKILVHVTLMTFPDWLWRA